MHRSVTSISWLSPKVCILQNWVESLIINFTQSLIIQHKRQKVYIKAIDSRFHFFKVAYIDTALIFDFIGNP